MCGFAGIFGNSEGADIEGAVNSLKHRGPDDCDTFSDRSIGLQLLHTRLSIIDTSINGRQPFVSKDGKYLIVFNGEIYNFLEIKNELKSYNFIFNSQSDTEVLLNFYIYCQENNIPLTKMLKKLNGIFAFAIWDYNKKTLTLARDALGVKPLYFSRTPINFVFGSEIKSLFKLSYFKTNLNYQAVLEHLVHLMCPGKQTIVENVFKVEPGQAMVINENLEYNLINWYDLKPFPVSKISLAMPMDVALSTTIEKLEKAVNKQLVSDVEVGSFLSGGLDSSLITYLAKQKTPNLRCFTIQVDGLSKEGFVDDLPFAKQVSEDIGVDLQVVEVNYNNIQNDICKMVEHLDEPLADPAALNVYYISKAARKKEIKVLLSGVGGDDLFTGYRRHQLIYLSKLFDKLPSSFFRFSSSFLSKLSQTNPIFRRANKFVKTNILRGDERLTSLFQWMHPKEAINLFSDDIKNSINEKDCSIEIKNFLSASNSGVSDLQKILSLEQKFFLSDHNLLYTDKMGMSQGVEIRVPFLDLDLLDFVNKMPDNYKISLLHSKMILRKAAESFLPKNIIYRKKTGFAVPLRKWLNDELKDWVDDLLSYKNVSERGIFNPTKVSNLVKLNRQGDIDASYTIFSIMCVELWCRKFINESN